MAVSALEHISFRLLHPDRKEVVRDQRETELRMLMATIAQTSDAYKQAEAELESIKEKQRWFYLGNDDSAHGPFGTKQMLE